MAVVKGKAEWASVQSPDTTFTPRYCINVIVDADTAKDLHKQGIKVKNDDEKGYVFKLKRNVMKADGSGQNQKPFVVGPDGKTPFSEDIGNGSEVGVQFQTYEWKNKFGSGIGVDLVGVQVIEHVVYSAGNEFEAVEGSEVPEAASGANEFDDDSPFKD